MRFVALGRSCVTPELATRSATVDSKLKWREGNKQMATEHNNFV